MFSKLLKGKGLGLQGSCQPLPTVCSVDLRGKMTYNYMCAPEEDGTCHVINDFIWEMSNG